MLRLDLAELRPSAAPGCARRTIGPERMAAARAALLDNAAHVDLAETCSVLADSTRARIVHALAVQVLCVCDLAELVGVSEPAVSQHVRLLRSLRIVRGRRLGKVAYDGLEDLHVRSLLAMALGHRDDRPTGGAGGVMVAEPCW